MENSKFIIVFDPIGWSGHGQYLIKENNEALTPYANISLGIGIDPVKSKQKALFKAETIVNALNEYLECLQKCESCEKEFEIDTMTTDADDNYFCNECWEELAPLMQKEYEELKAKGEIE